MNAGGAIGAGPDIFMESLMQPDELRTRMMMWAEEQVRLGKLPPKSGAMLEAALYRGELPTQRTSEHVPRRMIAASPASTREAA